MTPSCCNRGFHFCTELKDCFNYYSFNPNNKVAEVEALGEIDTERTGNKHCTNKIKIIREISWEEVLKMINVGKANTGFGNTGKNNSGNYNGGDFNKINFSNGCFNTKESKILMFNKPSDWSIEDWRYSEAKRLLDNIMYNVLKWIYSYEMTDEEKEQHPEYETTGGYLKKCDKSECNQLWWDSLSDHEKDIIKSLPNFDAEIFKEITGIDINKGV